MEIGLNFQASFDAVQQARLAEALGFANIGFFDSPALGADVWITVANALQATHHIKIGPQVLIPHMRHTMVQAAAIATIAHLAPGRLWVGLGTGFTGRMAMGQRPLTWASMSSFVKDIKALLAGGDAEIEGGLNRMLHAPRFGRERPIHVPFLIAANGPKGIAVARELGEGLIYGGDLDTVPAGFPVLQLGFGGILLEDGESPHSSRALEAAKPWFGLRYHLSYDGFHHGPSPVENLPYGADWLRAVEAIPATARHLHAHDGHTVSLNALDAAFTERHPDALAAYVADTAIRPAQIRPMIEAFAAKGATRISCRVTFNDWERDMLRWADALGLQRRF